MNSPKILYIKERVTEKLPPTITLTLDFHSRRKNRLRTTLSDGTSVLLYLPRGNLLRDGDLLRAEDGTVVMIKSAVEHVSTAYSSDNELLARVCYHLGKRQIPLQVGNNWLRYHHDPQLDAFVTTFGLFIQVENESFNPEGDLFPLYF